MEGVLPDIIYVYTLYRYIHVMIIRYVHMGMSENRLFPCSLLAIPFHPDQIPLNPDIWFNVVQMHSSKSHEIHISTSIFYPFKGTRWHDLLKSSWDLRCNQCNHFYDQKDFYIITYNYIYSKSHAIPIKSHEIQISDTRFRASSTETCALGGWSAAAPPTPPRTMPSAPPWKRRTSGNW